MKMQFKADYSVRSLMGGIAICIFSFVGTMFTAVELQAQQQDPQRSLSTGNQLVQVEFVNPTGKNLNLYWVDFNGQAQSFGSLPANSRAQAESYPGHLWMMGSGNQTLGRYRVTTTAKQQYSVGTQPVVQQRPTITSTTTTPVPNQQNPGFVISNQFNRNQQTPTGNVQNNREQQMKAILGGALQQIIQQKTGVNLGGVPSTNQGTNSTMILPQQQTVIPQQQPQQQTVIPQRNIPPANTTTGAIQNIQNTGSQITSAQAQQLVAYHNQARSEVGVGNVSWNPQIAAYAQQWANHMAQTGSFAHRPQNQQKYGENLATGTAGAFTVVALAKQWYDEKPLYRPAGAPFSMSLMPAGHYTQMVWRGTTQIGAGIATGTTGQLRGMTILVCNYNPRGNMLGQPAF